MISSILLAAGLSTRMGRPKALLDWGGVPLIRYQIEQLKAAGADEVIVVLGYRADEIHRTIRDLPVRVMFNPRFQFGRAGSLRLGAKAANRDAEKIVIVNVDQPRPASLIRELLEAHDTSFAATVPVAQGHRGHPVVVSGWLRQELMAADDESEGLRGILARHAAAVREYPASDLCLLDINTPDEYEEALRLFALAR
ncbi:MAG: nucleotidyltransferase family protein [Chloroflexota bacterium]|nr:nucleotidyltransferase family protein [Dehalococcoidia bacterium]MDW8045931.1 nucleotidyltransferase family protein [Chloroflexota bacterium]